MSGHSQDGDGLGSGSSADYGYGSGSPSSPYSPHPYSPSPFASGSSSVPSTGGPYGDSSHMVPYGQPNPYGQPDPYNQPDPYGQTYGAPQSVDPYAGAYPSENHARPTNTLALLSLIFSLAGLVTSGVTCIVGVILGHVARSQIRRTGESGGGLALGGIIVGYSLLGLGVAGIVLYFLAMFFAIATYA